MSSLVGSVVRSLAWLSCLPCLAACEFVGLLVCCLCACVLVVLSVCLAAPVCLLACLFDCLCVCLLAGWLLGLAWLGLAWLGLAWLGLAWLGLAWLASLQTSADRPLTRQIHQDGTRFLGGFGAAMQIRSPALRLGRGFRVTKLHQIPRSSRCPLLLRKLVGVLFTVVVYASPPEHFEFRFRNVAWKLRIQCVEIFLHRRDRASCGVQVFAWVLRC